MTDNADYDAARLAPFLVLLSEHMPRPGQYQGAPARCSCGNPLYAGHLAVLLAQRFEPRVIPSATTQGRDA